MFLSLLANGITLIFLKFANLFHLKYLAYAHSLSKNSFQRFLKIQLFHNKM